MAPVALLSAGVLAGAASPLEISDGMKVTVEFTLSLPDKTVLETTKGQPPLTYVQGRHEILSSLEKALTGMKAGDHKLVTLTPDQAFGAYDEKKKVTVPKSKVPPEAKVGTKLRGQNGLEAKVVEVKGDSVVVDTNHPLAGKTLLYDVKIAKVEKAPKADTPAK